MVLRMWMLSFCTARQVRSYMQQKIMTSSVDKVDSVVEFVVSGFTEITTLKVAYFLVYFKLMVTPKH